jgi:hypothetical protein
MTKSGLPWLAVLCLFAHFSPLSAQIRETSRLHEWVAVSISSVDFVWNKRSAPALQVEALAVVVTNFSENATSSFNLKAISGLTIIGEKKIKLAANATDTIRFEWKPAIADAYAVQVIADPEGVLPEKKRTDNLFEVEWRAPSINAPVAQIKPAFVPIDLVSPNTTQLLASTPVNEWHSAGPSYINVTGYPWSLAGGRLSAIAIHPTITNLMYVGAQSSGIWKTDDGGQTWAPLAEHISMSVAALALAPNNANRLYWVTHEEGVFRSNNGGVSWTKISDQDLQATVHGGKLLIHPLNPDVMFVKSKIGLYRSIDGGTSWERVGPDAEATGLELTGANQDRLYATFSHTTDNSKAGLFLSYDNGATWTKKLGCPGAALPATVNGYKITLAHSNGKLFVGFKSSQEFKLYYTTNLACVVGGVHDDEWKKGWSTTTDHPELWSGLWANPYDKNRLYLGGTAFWRSTNGGVTFTKVSDYNTSSNSAHADHHGFAVLPGNKDIVFTLNDGGIYRSTKNAEKGSWTFIGKGIANVEFYDFTSAYTNASLMIGGTQDNGTIKTTGNLDWKSIRGGDGATVDIDRQNASIMYGMGQYAPSIDRSTNGGEDWSDMAAGLPAGNDCFNLKWHLHPTNGNILLASCNGLWRITNPAAGTWQTIFTPQTGNVLCSAVMREGDVYLAGASDGKLYAGVGGTNFQQAFLGSAMAITDIENDPELASVVYVAYRGNTTRRIFRLVKNGAQPISFQNTDITANLPVNLAVQCLAVDRMHPFTLFAGTNKGVYKGVSTNNGQTWQWSAYMQGFAVADVRDLEVHPTTGILRACTFGRGIHEVDTGNPLGSILAVEGKITLLRVHDVGTGYGPPGDALDAEMIVVLDSKPQDYFGAQLRVGAQAEARMGMLEVLRKAFKNNTPVRIEYERTGIHSGRMFRVMAIK